MVYFLITRWKWIGNELGNYFKVSNLRDFFLTIYCKCMYSQFFELLQFKSDGGNESVCLYIYIGGSFIWRLYYIWNQDIPTFVYLFPCKLQNWQFWIVDLNIKTNVCYLLLHQQMFCIQPAVADSKTLVFIRPATWNISVSHHLSFSAHKLICYREKHKINHKRVFVFKETVFVIDLKRTPQLCQVFLPSFKGRTENWDHVKNVDVIQELRSGTIGQGHNVSGDCVWENYISQATVQTLELQSQENPFHTKKAGHIRLNVWMLTGADVNIMNYSFDVLADTPGRRERDLWY